jgi:hypothetical protein
MRWSARYAVGIKRLDHQHKMLFRMVDDFRDALDNGQAERVYDVLLKSLEVYFHGHVHYSGHAMLRKRVGGRRLPDGTYKIALLRPFSLMPGRGVLCRTCTNTRTEGTVARHELLKKRLDPTFGLRPTLQWVEIVRRVTRES